ncbi:MAG: hypothetical protein J6O18_01175 [Bacilli bacterium]|nr:hypothetical protein [Bacilli bacterium]
MTAVVLRCDQSVLGAIEEQLRSIRFVELLFLKHIAEIRIETPNIQRHIRVIPSNPFRIEDNDKTSSWRVWRKEGALAQNDGSQKHYELAIAYSEDPEVRELLKKEGCLYSFFKTEVPMRMPFLVHGTFELTSERNGLEKDNDNNRRLLSILTDFIVEIGEEIAHKRESADYAALMFVLPPTNGYFNGGYDFYGELKSKIKGCRLFPSIRGEYLSLEDNPRYSLNRFDEVLNKEDFRALLIHCEDPRVEPFLSECRIFFYECGEFCKLINPRAEEYILSGTNVEIIHLYHEEFGSEVSFAPYLLVDSEGKRITDRSLKIFNNPTEAFALPSWSTMRFIDAKLWARLSEALEISRANDLAKALRRLTWKNIPLIRWSLR